MSAEARRLGAKAVGSPADAQFVRDNIQEVLQKVEDGGTASTAGKPQSWTLSPTVELLATLIPLSQQVVRGPADQSLTGKQPTTHGATTQLDVVSANLHLDS